MCQMCVAFVCPEGLVPWDEITTDTLFIKDKKKERKKKKTQKNKERREDVHGSADLYRSMIH